MWKELTNAPVDQKVSVYDIIRKLFSEDFDGSNLISDKRWDETLLRLRTIEQFRKEQLQRLPLTGPNKVPGLAISITYI